jgi:hypothetical protein
LTVTVTTAGATSLLVSHDSIVKTVPRDLGNREYNSLLGVSYTTIDRDGAYNAFPMSQVIGSSIVAIYSKGPAHGNSDWQYMIRSDDDGETWQSELFFTNDTLAFGSFNLLSDLMADGDIHWWKSLKVTKAAGVITGSVTATVSYGGTTYALWSQPKLIGSTWYRTGYGDSKSALFSSADKVAWTGVGIIASSGGLSFSEADIVQTTSTSNLLAIIREDSAGNRNLYSAVSSNGGATWGSLTLLDVTKFNGTQPNLLRLASGEILLANGDRSGTSGFTVGGLPSTQIDITGVSVQRSTDNGANWTFKTMIERTYSTDGGQPQMIEYDTDLVQMLFYNTLRGDLRSTGVVSAKFSAAGIV